MTQPSRTGSGLGKHAGKRLDGGRRARVLFSKLLGFAREGFPFAIVSVRWVEHRFELRCVEPGGAGVTLVLERRAGEPEHRPFAQSGDLSLWYRDGELPKDAAREASRALPRWRGLTFDGLVERFLEDPDLETPSPIEGGSAAGAKRGRRDVGVFRPEERYADFLAFDEVSLFPIESIERATENELVTVQHADLECSTFSPSAEPSNMHLVSFPWVGEVEKRKGSGAVAARAQDHEIALFTDLEEKDVILGGLHKLRGILEHVNDAYADRPVLFTNTCVPATTGEDVASVVEHYQAKRRLPILFHNRAIAESTVELFDEVLGSVRGPSTTAAGGRRVNLIGFSAGPARDEICSMLEELGVTVNAFLLPSLDRPSLEAVRDASVDVYLRVNKEWDHLYRALAAHRGHATQLFPAAPYGLALTRAFLEEVGGAVGVERAQADGVLDGRVERLGPRWPELVERAKAQRVGLVVRPLDLHYLSDASYTWGVPVIDVLETMGFSLDFLVQGEGPAAEPSVARLRGMVSDAERHSFSSFDGLEGLRAALSSAPCAAVLSNHVFDWRLTEAGKGRFSLQCFDMGVQGARVTLEALLAACETPFYRRYARYLRRDAIGLPSREDGGPRVGG